MNKVILAAVAALLFLSACSTVPITGRRQLKLVPESTMMAQSALSYREVLDEGPLSTDRRQTAMVKRVGTRISAAVEQYFSEQGAADQLAGFAWEFNLIEQDVPNAWCMPGGKVAFYSGILPFTRNEAGMAVVMGHEIAHAVVGHGTERVSQQLLQQGGGYLASYLARESDYHDAIVQLYGLGSQVGVILPYSRLHEREADRLGLIFMAMAGYNPNASVAFWQRMAAGEGEKPPEFMSTHPSDETRIRELKHYIPEAMQHYRPQ